MNKKYKKYIDYIVKDIELPYLRSLEPYGLKEDEIDLVLSKVFNQPVYYIEPMSGVYNKDRSVIYSETSNGYWVKYEYNEDGNLTYVKDSKGYWSKREYDELGNITYTEDSGGILNDNR